MQYMQTELLRSINHGHHGREMEGKAGVRTGIRHAADDIG